VKSREKRERRKTLSMATAADRLAIVSVVDRLVEGSFDCTDVTDLFLRLRAYLPDENPVKEVANFVAHSDRDKGVAYKQTEAFAANVVSVMNAQHGTMSWKKPVFSWTDLFTSLRTTLKSLTLDTDWQARVAAIQFGQLTECINRMLDNRSMNLRNPHVVECNVHRDRSAPKEPVVISFRLSGVRNTSPTVSWQVSFFDNVV
jgi:hypothetical protein